MTAFSPRANGVLRREAPNLDWFLLSPAWSWPVWGTLNRLQKLPKSPMRLTKASPTLYSQEPTYLTSPSICRAQTKHSCGNVFVWYARPCLRWIVRLMCMGKGLRIWNDMKKWSKPVFRPDGESPTLHPRRLEIQKQDTYSTLSSAALHTFLLPAKRGILSPQSAGTNRI